MGMDNNKKQQMTAKEIAEYIAEEIRSITGGCDADAHTNKTHTRPSRPYTYIYLNPTTNRPPSSIATGCADVLVTSGLTTLGLDSLGFVEVGQGLVG